MKIQPDEVRHIAKLAKLRFSDEEILKLAREFESILDHFQSIDKMDLENVNLDEFSKGQKSVVRTDINRSFDDKAKLFQNTKSMRDTFIQVPKIIEQ